MFSVFISTRFLQTLAILAGLSLLLSLGACSSNTNSSDQATNAAASPETTVTAPPAPPSASTLATPPPASQPAPTVAAAPPVARKPRHSMHRCHDTDLARVLAQPANFDYRAFTDTCGPRAATHLLEYQLEQADSTALLDSGMITLYGKLCPHADAELTITLLKQLGQLWRTNPPALLDTVRAYGSPCLAAHLHMAVLQDLYYEREAAPELAAAEQDSFQVRAVDSGFVGERLKALALSEGQQQYYLDSVVPAHAAYFGK